MENRDNQREQDLRRIAALRYMDDDFMTVCFDNNIEGVELLLHILLGRDDIKVDRVTTQKMLKNLNGRSSILDIQATDSEKKEYDVEIQRADKGTGAKRARHNSSLLDAHILKAGEDTERLPETYVIFITENDVLGGGQAVYRVDRYVTIGIKQKLFGDGSHILYVNGKYRGDDAVGRLMHDFSCTNPDDMNYDVLARQARYYKSDKEGVAAMCKLLEDMRNETAKEAAKEAALETSKENAIRMLKDGVLSVEQIARYTNLSSEIIQKLKEDVFQMA